MFVFIGVTAVIAGVVNGYILGRSVFGMLSGIVGGFLGGLAGATLGAYLLSSLPKILRGLVRVGALAEPDFEARYPEVPDGLGQGDQPGR